MTRNEQSDEYFFWLCGLIGENRDKFQYSERISFERLLEYLFRKRFRYILARDKNRYEDGIDLRSRFEEVSDSCVYLTGPCSVLEMMVALALRCEETIMLDPSDVNRTGQWFWGMVVSLGLGSMTDDRFDLHFVDDVIETFLNREYEPNGKGGLFTIDNCENVRDVEIWYQLCWFIDSIT